MARRAGEAVASGRVQTDGRSDRTAGLPGDDFFESIGPRSFGTGVLIGFAGGSGLLIRLPFDSLDG